MLLIQFGQLNLVSWELSPYTVNVICEQLTLLGNIKWGFGWPCSKMGEELKVLLVPQQGEAMLRTDAEMQALCRACCTMQRLRQKLQATCRRMEDPIQNAILEEDSDEVESDDDSNDTSSGSAMDISGP